MKKRGITVLFGFFGFLYLIHYAVFLLEENVFTADRRTIEELSGYSSVGVLLKNISSNPRIRSNFRNWARSLLMKTGKISIRLLFLTDRDGVHVIKKILEDILPRLKILEHPKFEFIDAEEIMDSIRSNISTMKTFFNHFNEGYVINDYSRKRVLEISYSSKYNDDLYYICPFYHILFPGLKRFIALDVDIQFRKGLSTLQKEFDKFLPEQIIGIANDLAPHYYQMLSSYRTKHPNTSLGNPGPTQGFNVGVVLYKLDRMRLDVTYNKFLRDDSISDLAEKYEFTRTHLGEQDWMTLLGWEAPNLFYLLSCRFNRQLGRDYDVYPWKKIFPAYHKCDEKDIVIVHGNGDSFPIS